MPSCDWNLSPNIFLKFISYERHQLSVPFMLLSSILLYNIHCVHPFTSWYRPSGIFLFGTIMNIIKALVFKYFCGYVFFFFLLLFLLSICLEVELFVLVFYLPLDSVCMATQVPG